MVNIVPGWREREDSHSAAMEFETFTRTRTVKTSAPLECSTYTTNSVYMDALVVVGVVGCCYRKKRD